jgi:MFS transporter, FHS family, L-fucose permease
MNNKQRLQLLILLLLNYFTFALITNIPGALFPFWKADFNLDDSTVRFLGFAFFLAYGLTSLPQGILIDKVGSKTAFIYGSALMAIGSLAFAFFPSFLMGLFSLFTIGIGVTALQIVGNLLVKEVDEDPAKYSSNLTMSQVFCGIGGFSGPWLIALLKDKLGWDWSAVYFVAAFLGLALCAFAVFTFIPSNNNSAAQVKGEEVKKPSLSDYLSLARNPLMLLFAFGIFIYVGIEVGIANWISTFLVDQHKFTVTDAGKIVSFYWALQSVGRFTGGFVLKVLDTPKALIVYSSACLGLLILACLIPSGNISSIAFIGIGFFTSIMFPSIFSLAVNSFDKSKESTVAGILCTAIIGGAVTQLLIGFIDQKLTHSLALSLIINGLISFAYIAFIGFRSLKNNSLSIENKVNSNPKTENHLNSNLNREEVLV